MNAVVVAGVMVILLIAFGLTFACGRLGSFPSWSLARLYTQSQLTLVDWHSNRYLTLHGRRVDTRAVDFIGWELLLLICYTWGSVLYTIFSK